MNARVSPTTPYSQSFSKSRRTTGGFTIIELLIVIVVIAILAVITIVAYNGITQKAHIATLQSDLSNGYTTAGTYSATNGNYPPDQPTAAFRSTTGDTLAYTVTSDNSAYCLEAAGWGLTYVVTNSNNVPQVGYCAGTTTATGHTATVSTYAGNGTGGYVDGAATSAEFLSPDGLAVNSSGTLYVADLWGECIRTLSPVPVVSTLAGACQTSMTGNGYADGTGTAAKFSEPNDAALDSSGNLYVADSGNNCIRKITSAAVVTTFAGTCSSTGSTAGYADGTGAAAKFYSPEGVAVDSSGNIYVADLYNNCIRKITTSQVTSTFAGVCNGIYGHTDGTGSAAAFAGPYFLTIDTSGNLYTTEYGGNCIRKITSAAIVTTLAGTCDPTGNSYGYADGTGAAARFDQPAGIAADSSGNVYVADSYNNCIRKITPAGVVTTYAGICNANFSSYGYVDGPAPTARFYLPMGIAVDSSGNVYVGDYDNHVIRKVTP